MPRTGRRLVVTLKAPNVEVDLYAGVIATMTRIETEIAAENQILV